MPRYTRFVVYAAVAVMVVTTVSNRVFAAEPSAAQIEEIKKSIDKDPGQARRELESNPLLLSKMSAAQRNEVMQYISAAEHKAAEPAPKPVPGEEQSAPSIAPAPLPTTPVTAAPAPPQPGTVSPVVKNKDSTVVREVYGRNVFSEEFINPQYIEIPDDYVIAPGDEILLRFWGAYNQERKYLIGSDGYVYIEPLKRQTYLIGTTFGALRRMVERVSDASPGVQGDVRVVNAHPVFVHVAGNALHPGTVSAPSYYTLWQFLMLCKGPSDNGSVRDIRVSRRGKEIVKIDIYDFLNSGRKPVITVQNEDQIFFGEAKRIIKVDSLVRRPGLYELRETERLGDLVNIAGGFVSGNFAPRIQIQRVVDIKEKSSSGFPYQVLDIDLSRSGWEKTELKDGDRVIARNMAPLTANDVYILGSGVAVPGRYSLPRQSWTAADLLQEAGGLVIGSHRSGELLRQNADGTRTQLPIDLYDADKLRAMSIVPHDSLITYHDSEFVDITTVKSRGFVRRPIEIRYSDSLTLADVLRKSEGLHDGALPYVYFKKTDDFGLVSYRRYDIADSAINATIKLSRRDEVMFFDYRAFNGKLPVMVLAYGKEPLLLQYSPDLTLEVAIHELGGIDPLIDSSHVEICVPDFKDALTFGVLKTYPLNAQTASQRDIIPQGSIVFLRKDPNKEYGNFVFVSGEVLRPGSYPLLRKDSRLSEIISLAGGLTRRANKWGITLVRSEKNDTLIRPKKSDTSARQGESDTFARQEENDTVIHQGKIQTIPVEVRNTGKLGFFSDWLLYNNDQIRVARNDYAVEVAGAVFDPRVAPWHQGYSGKDYVNYGGGGALDTGDVKKTYVRYPNGITKKAHTGWWIFSSNADVPPGSRVVVPRKPYKAPEPAGKEGEKTDYAKLISVTSASLMSILSVLIIMNQLK